MSIKWKNKKNFNPKIILEKLETIKSLSEGKVAFEGHREFEYAISALESMLSFSEELVDFSKEALISKAVFEAAKHDKLSNVGFLKVLNDLAWKESARKEKEFYLLTSVSFRNNFPERKYCVESCNIQLLQGNYDKKFSGRDKVISSLIGSLPKIQRRANNYTKIVIKCKAKTEIGAVSRCMKAIDIQRAVWCLFANHFMEIIGNEWMPINNVRLGEIHTLHYSDGKAWEEGIWYEPNFVESSLFSPSKKDIFIGNCSWVFAQLEKCKYSTKLKGALLQFVRALDEKDKNTVFIRLWGALESLTSPDQANYDLVIKRTSFIFDEGYHKQVLEHLREYRNSTVHSGEMKDKAKKNCFQLQNYFKELFLFHLSNVDNFKSLVEVNEYLDLPVEKQSLEKRKLFLEMAMRFRFGNE